MPKEAEDSRKPTFLVNDAKEIGIVAVEEAVEKAAIKASGLLGEISVAIPKNQISDGLDSK
jgi:hypothetical protein